MSNNGVYWPDFVNILDIQFHETLYIIDKYNDDSMTGSVAACIKYMLVLSTSLFIILFYFYFLCNSFAFVANEDIYIYISTVM